MDEAELRLRLVLMYKKNNPKVSPQKLLNQKPIARTKVLAMGLVEVTGLEHKRNRQKPLILG